MDARLGLEAGTVARLTGVEERSFCGPSDDQITMAKAAADQAMAAAGVMASDIDLVISAAAVPYQPIPATAPRIMAALRIEDGAAFGFDINSTCLGFLNALETCDGLLASGRYARALVVSSEVASRALPWETKPEIAGLFGDGAAAAVLEPGDPGQLAATAFETHPSLYDACGIGAGGTRIDYHATPQDFAAHAFFDMEGRDLFRVSAKHFGRFVDGLLARAGWTKQDVDCVVPHQASPAALDHMIRQTGFDAARVIDITRSYGNQIAASIPTALHVADREGRLVAGAKVLALGTSAGVSFGGAALVI
jgi:3-oxoacyl-[acyl-carrier-protein] synthase-3